MKYILLVLICFPSVSGAVLQVATTTTDLAAIVKEVGLDQVGVFAIAKGTQDPHQIEAKPSFMTKLRSVDLVISQGLDLESAWIAPLIQGSRNPKLATKGGLFEVAADLDPIEIPMGEVSRAHGDVHPGGNPHFQLDPIRVGRAALLIAKKLGELDSAYKDFFEKNAKDFQNKMIEKEKIWQDRIKKSGISEIVTYHKTFAYFCDRFALRCSTQLEPKPGIPPTAGHILAVLDQMKKNHIKLVFIENLYDDSVSDKLKSVIPNVIVKRIPVSIEGEPGIRTNEELIERIVRAVEEGSR